MIEVIKLTGTIGAEIKGVDLSTELPPRNGRRRQGRAP